MATERRGPICSFPFALATIAQVRKFRIFCDAGPPQDRVTIQAMDSALLGLRSHAL